MTATSRAQATERRRQRRVVLWLLLALTLALRMWHLGDMPPPLATADEVHYTWSGLGLWSRGEPRAWSHLPAYQGTAALLGTISAQSLNGLVGLPDAGDPTGLGALLRGSKPESPDILTPIVEPALDHPPLFSLLAGGFARVVGAAKPATVPVTAGSTIELWKLNLARARVLAALLGTLSALLLYDLAARRAGFHVAVLAVGLYAINQHNVMHQRLLVTEALSTPLLLAALCAWERLRVGHWGEGRFATVAIVTTAAALLTKLIAASQAVALVALMLPAGRKRPLLYPLAGVVLGGALYAGYGAWQGWDVFTRVLGVQAERFEGFALLRSLVSNPLLIEMRSFNTLVFLGWVSLLGLGISGARLRGRGLLVAAYAYGLAFAYFAAVNQMFGWHALPFMPFLMLALAMTLMRVWRQPDAISSTAWLLLLLPAGFEFVLGQWPDGAGVIRPGYVLVTAGAILAPVIWPARAVTVRRGVLAGALALIVMHQLWGLWLFGG